MQQYSNTFQNSLGRPVTSDDNAQIEVYTYPDNVLAVLYSDNGVTPKANPVTTDENGLFEFYAADGRYTLVLTSDTTEDVTLTDGVLLEDPADGSEALAATTGAGLVGFSYALTYAVGTIGKWLKDLATSAGASFIGWIQSGTGAQATTLQEVARRTVSPQDFMTDAQKMNVYLKLGTVDVSDAWNAMLATGCTDVEVPAGWYLVDNVQIPNTFGLTIRGSVGGTVLVQKSGGNSIFKWDSSSINYSEQHIKGITFKGTNGANHCVNTAGAGGLTLSDIYVRDVPTGYSGIYINGAAATYVHDIRINGLQIYSNTAGHSGIRFGPLTSDSSVTDFIMNGNFVVGYCAYYDIGATTIRMTDAHPYNAAVNIVKMAGSNHQCAFEDSVFDNATENLFEIANSNFITFTNTWFEAIKAAKSGLNLVSAVAVTMSNTRFEGAVGAASAVTGDAGSTDVNIILGSLGTVANYVTPFSFAGARCYAKAFPGYNPQGLTYGFSGATVSAQAQNTTQHLGVNGAQAAINNTYYVVPEDGTLADFYVAVGSTPAAGQTYTFNLQKGGVTVATTTVSNGGFGGSTIAANVSVSRGDTVSIESVFSATSGASNIRYSVRLRA